MKPETRAELHSALFDWLGAKPGEAATSAFKRIDAILDRLHEREETEEQRAERLLGEWAYEHPGEVWVHFPPLHGLRDSHMAKVGGATRGFEAPTKAAAILDALSKAKEASGGA